MIPKNDYSKTLNEAILLRKNRFSLSNHLKSSKVSFDNNIYIDNSISINKIREKVYGYKIIDMKDLAEILLSIIS